jgi:hypothetical protein
MKPIEKPNTQCEDKSYWEKVLASHNLGMNRGHRPNRTSFRGGINELVVAEQIEYEKETGAVKPPGHGPDEGT